MFIPKPMLLCTDDQCQASTGINFGLCLSVCERGRGSKTRNKPLKYSTASSKTRLRSLSYPLSVPVTRNKCQKVSFQNQTHHEQLMFKDVIIYFTVYL